MKPTRLKAPVRALLVLGLFVSCLTLMLSPPAWAETFEVTRNDDPAPDGCAADDCSLREAIAAANANSEADTITFALPSGATGIALGGTQLEITSNLTITGPGAEEFTVSGNGASRVFSVSSAADDAAISGLAVRSGRVAGSDNLGGGINNAGTLTLDGVIVGANVVEGDTSSLGGGIHNADGGDLTLTDSTVSDNSAVGGNINGLGGGINNSGTLTLENTVVSGNSTAGGFGGGGLGGGISNIAGGDLTLTDSTVSENRAAGRDGSDGRNGGNGSGGGIFNEAALTLDGSTVSGNTTQGGDGSGSNFGGTGSGGGIFNASDGETTLDGSTVSGNTAEGGGGILARGGGIFNANTFTIDNSTVSGNTAEGGSESGALGGGVYNVGGGLSDELAITNATVSGNIAQRGDGSPGDGGGVYIDNGTATFTSVTLARNDGTPANFVNFGGDAQFRNTIVSEPMNGSNCNGEFTSNGHNLEDTNTCNFNVATDQPNTDPMLEDLDDNGGPTETHALPESSPAVDQGTSEGLPEPATDQRGVPRPQDAPGVDDADDGSDIGAFELGFSVATVSPASLDFGEQEIEKLGQAMSVNVTNSGVSPLSITNVAKSGPNRSDFIKTDDDCTGETLDPGESCNVVLRFSPEAEGDRSAELIISSNDPNGPSTASLSGTGTETPAPGPTNPNACTIVGTPGNDRLVGTSGRDVICGRSGNDVIRGIGGNDLIRGAPGNDRIFGGAGNDRLIGGPGRDKLFGQVGKDRLNARDGVRGNDVANGGPGRDRCASDARDVKRSCP